MGRQSRGPDGPLSTPGLACQVEPAELAVRADGGPSQSRRGCGLWVTGRKNTPGGLRDCGGDEAMEHRGQGGHDMTTMALLDWAVGDDVAGLRNGDRLPSVRNAA